MEVSGHTINGNERISQPLTMANLVETIGNLQLQNKLWNRVHPQVCE